jgi:toxin ParE1/3/4
MTSFTVSAIAGQRLDEIYVYTRDTWGEAQAESYVRELFRCFDRIVRRDQVWRVVPAEFGVDGFYCRHAHHYIYWRQFADGMVGIVMILHERMHQMDRFREDNAP